MQENKTRQQIIQMLTEIQTEIKVLESKVATIPSPSEFGTKIRERLKQVKMKKMCVESQIATSLPIEIEGFLAEDVGDVVDRDEHGTIREIFQYLGCPNFNSKHPGMSRIAYDEFRDVSEILKHNTERFLRITIEAIPLGESENCAKCDNRFRCLTTRCKS